MASIIEEIVKKAKHCLRQGKKPVSAYVALGIASFEEGDAVKAIKHYQKALAISDDSAEAHAGLGISFARTGNLEKSLVHLIRSFELNPECGLLANWIADAYFDKGDFDNAVIFYTEAIRLNASDSNAHNDMADVFRLRGNFVEALKLYEKTIELDQHDTNARLERAQCLIQLGKNEDALDALKELVDAYPTCKDSETATVICGTLYFKKSEFAEALKWLQRSVDYFPFNRSILFQAAICADKTGDSSECVKLLKKILELDKNDFRAAAMLKKVSPKCI